MSKKLSAVICAVAVIALCLSAVNLYLALRPQEQPAADVQYVLYLGTNDKDTNEPVFAPEEAKAKLKSILIQSLGEYTIQEANGGWVDGEKIYREYTPVIYLSDTDIESVHAACDEMIQVFNQSSVLIQANKTATEFYAG